MAVFSLVVANVKTAYDAFVTATVATAAAQAALTASPAKPTIVVTDADWNNWVTSYDSWVTTNAAALATLATAKTVQRNAEVGVLTRLGVGSGDESQSICLDQWVHLIGAGSGPLTYSVWIGASVYSSYLSPILTSIPANAYPNI